MAQLSDLPPTCNCRYWTPSQVIRLLFPTWLHEALGIVGSERLHEPADYASANPPFREMTEPDDDPPRIPVQEPQTV